MPFTRPPQTAFEYSNFGYAVLGRIVTNVSAGRSNYIMAEIMGPLGMASTGYDIARSPARAARAGYRWENEAWSREPDMARGGFGAMGGVQTSANDCTRWVAFLLSAWPPRDGAEQGPARRATVRELAQGSNFPRWPAAPAAAATPAGRRLRHGDAGRGRLRCRPDPGHGGGYPGYGSYLLLLPTTASASSR